MFQFETSSLSLSERQIMEEKATGLESQWGGVGPRGSTFNNNNNNNNNDNDNDNDDVDDHNNNNNNNNNNNKNKNTNNIIINNNNNNLTGGPTRFDPRSVTLRRAGLYGQTRYTRGSFPPRVPPIPASRPTSSGLFMCMAPPPTEMIPDRMVKL